MRRGAGAERAAARWLERRGARLLARNARRGRGELDLVAFWDGVVVFVEVKQRQELTEGLAAVHADKRRRIEQAASLWLAEHPELAASPCRFDVIVITCGRWGRVRVTHLPDAWRMGE